MLEGWLTKEGMWRIPLIGGQESEGDNIVPDMVKIRASRAPPTDQIANVYNKTTHQAMCRCYHAAAGFPPKPTWLAALTNGHYKTWTGLSTRMIRRHFR